MGELGTAQSQKSYIYSATQPDRLIDCDGTSITYNGIGCPTVYDGYTTLWDRGKLSSLTIGSRFNITDKYTFSYNALGQRIQKEFWHPIPSSGNAAVMKGELTRYIRDYCYDESGRLISEHILSQCYQEDDSVDYLVYLYDGDMIIGVVHTAVPGATNTYYFERNLLGDVIAIYDTSGNRVGAYTYDAWGNCRIAENLQRIVTLNPIRYRGYYYDQDTKLYYLGARYYCPEWRRFISPDDTSYLDPETPNGLNLYAYCGNDPVNKYDPSGHFAISLTLLGLIIGAAIGATAGGIAAYNIAKNNGAEGWELFGWTMAGIVGGGVVGGALGAGVGALVTKATGVIGLSITKYSIIPIKGTTVLGHMPGYIGAAQATGSGYYLVSNGTYEKMVQKGVEWTNNMTYLKDANSLGSRFALAPDFVVREGGTFWKEIQYLIENGILWEMF